MTKYWGIFLVSFVLESKMEKEISIGDLVQFVTALITIVIALFTFLQLKLLNKQNKARIVIDLYSEFREKKWHDCRMEIKNSENIVFAGNIRSYSHLLNHIGFLLAHKYIDVKSLYPMLGDSVIKTWDKLEPFIKKEREDSDFPLFQVQFEYLVKEMRLYQTKNANNKYLGLYNVKNTTRAITSKANKPNIQA
jgi:hypothetical protein